MGIRAARRQATRMSRDHERQGCRGNASPRFRDAPGEGRRRTLPSGRFVQEKHIDHIGSKFHTTRKEGYGFDSLDTHSYRPVT